MRSLSCCKVRVRDPDYRPAVMGRADYGLGLIISFPECREIAVDALLLDI